MTAALRSLLCVTLALLITSSRAVAASCPPPRAQWYDQASANSDCVAAIPVPRGFPTQGRTFTIHPGQPGPCVVHLPGDVWLCAGGETAPDSARYGRGRALFRISGNGPSGVGGLNIVVSASITDTPPNAPELLPALNADAVLKLPPDTIVVRFDPGSGRFVPASAAHIRMAGLYKVLHRGNPALPPPAVPSLPATLPATGASPFGALLALAALAALAGLWLARGVLRRSRRDGRGKVVQERMGLVLLAAGVLLGGSTGLSYAYTATRPAPGFGSLTDVAGPSPKIATAPSAPARLVIARLGINTPVVPLTIVNGAWQVPAYAAGYLVARERPGGGGANQVITGHDDRDGAVFRRLGELRPGDVVQVFAAGRVYRYSVFALGTVPATRTDLLRPTRDSILTLITCTPYLIDTARLVARARLTSSE